MKAVDLIQGTEGWLEWRRSGIGASDIAAIIGISPFKTAMDVYEEKLGLTSSKDPNPYMLRGQMYEEEARNEFTSKYGGSYEPICCQHDQHPYIIASLDGYDRKTKIILEIKIPGKKVMELARAGIIPDYYKVQMDWQMLAKTDACSAIYAPYCPETKEVYRIPYPRDEIATESLKKASRKFWDDFRLGIFPPLQKGDFLEIDDPAFEKVATEYIDIHNQIKILEGKKKSIKPKVLDFGDDGNFRGFGLKCLKISGRSTYDMKKMEEEGININKYKKISTSYYYRIDVA